ncbi:MAG: zinc ribbon domain-containing protein [Terrimicrobiaceae bacterium]
MRACQHCGTQNDDTRVFCGNCGTRLPAPDSSGPTAPPALQAPRAGAAPGLPSAGISAPPLPESAFRKKRRASRPAPVSERGASGFLVSSIFWLAVVSATLACMIQMVRAPDNVPAPAGADTSAARETFSTLKELAESAKPISWTVNSKAVNQFLESTIEMKPNETGLSALTARFQRAFVNLHQGSLTLCVDQKFLGADLYFLLDVVPEKSGPGLGARVTGGGIGRLPVHPALLPVFQRLFTPVLAGLSQPLDILKKAKSATITPDDATLQWPGTGKKP